MDVSPQAIREVQFRERLRGYHPDDVDDYLAAVAAAMESLQQRLQQATEEARSLGPPGTAGEVEESLRRTLVLAQRTADLAVKEARDEAARLVAEAEARRDEIRAEADALRERLSEEAKQGVGREVERLREQREGLEGEVAALGDFLAAERARVRELLAEQLRRLDDDDFALAPAPPLSELPPRPEGGGEGAATAVHDALAADVVVLDGDDSDDDPFMAELRRAATDDEPLGPRDLPAATFRSGDIDIFEEAGERRMGSRLRRRR